MARMTRTLAILAVGVAVALGVQGCASSLDEDSSSSFALPKLADLNPFQINKATLPGKRIAVLTSEDTLNTHMEEATGSIAIPPPQQLAEWATPGGMPSNAPGHLALNGSLRTLWTAEAGTGSSSVAKLTASPIVHQGRVYVFDAASHVAAFSASGGSRAWSVKVSPDGESETKAFGGGIAAEGGRVFAVTGFGTAVAIDAGTGARLWEKKLGAPFHSAPTVTDGRMFATNTDGQVVCLAVADGTVLWTYHGVPQSSAALLTNTRPAVSGDSVVVPFTSGDLVSLKTDSGQPVWSDTLNGARASASIASLSDPASPVASGGSVYAVSRSGRMISTNEDTGVRAWSMNVASVQTPWVAGDAVYVVDITGRLLALKRTNGEIRWAVKLPGEAKVWSGPVLAGNKLWVTSSKGKLVGVDPITGKPVAERDLGAPLYLAPVVADGRMYVLTDRASLVAIE